MKKSQIAAMFGLDARIALAIFGALSVISGAALYSALNNVEKIQVITIFTETEKALTQYLLDTSTHFTTHSFAGSNHWTNTSYLVENSANISGWKGPYLQYQKKDIRAINHGLVFSSVENHVNMFLARDSLDWEWLAFPATECNGSGDCYYVMGISRVSLDLAKKVDIAIDGVNVSNKGKIRYYATGDEAFIYYITNVRKPE